MVEDARAAEGTGKKAEDKTTMGHWKVPNPIHIGNPGPVFLSLPLVVQNSSIKNLSEVVMPSNASNLFFVFENL